MRILQKVSSGEAAFQIGPLTMGAHLPNGANGFGELRASGTNNVCGLYHLIHGGLTSGSHLPSDVTSQPLPSLAFSNRYPQSKASDFDVNERFQSALFINSIAGHKQTWTKITLM